MNTRLKRILIWGVAIWGILPFLYAIVHNLFDKAGVPAATEKTSVAGAAPVRYDTFFEGNFKVEVTPDRNPNNEKQLVFYKDGTAVLQHDNNHTALLDFYTYEPTGDGIRLKGEGVVKVQSTIRVLADVPGDIVLHSVSRTDSVVLEGTSGRDGQTFRLSPTQGWRYSSLPVKAFDAIHAYKRMAALPPDNLWVVTSDRLQAFTGKNAGEVCKVFSRKDLVYGTVDPADSLYIRLPYTGGTYAYADVGDVERVGSARQLAALMEEDGMRAVNFTRWTDDFEQIERRTVKMTYFNGWRAGILAVEFFFYFAGWMLLLLVVNRTAGVSGRVWRLLGKTTLVVLTLMELWYAGSVGLDALLYIFDTNLLAAIFTPICLSGLFILQSWLLYAVESDLLSDNNAYSSVPAWVEYVLVAVLGIAAIPVALAAERAVRGLGVVVEYGALMVAVLPSTISLCRHSDRVRPMFLFFLLCEPMRYVILLFGWIAKAVVGTLSMKNKFEGPEEGNHVSAVDINGNQVDLSRLPGESGAYMDPQGRLYGRQGDSFYPLGPGNNSTFNKQSSQ